VLIPYSSDAPLYHFPYTTIGLIAVNVMMYFVTAGIAMNDLPSDEAEAGQRQESRSILWLADSPKVRWLNLEFDRVLPTQWLTHAFMHADIFHLLGNMVFLWAFGLVVEGKVGWKRMLLIYATMCVVQGALIQIIMWLLNDRPGSALGASGAIFGLMAIAVVWAPKNEMNCVLILFPIVRVFELTIIMLGFIYLALQLLFFSLHGFGMSSEALHLTGIAIGVPIGLLFLRRNWVDCEGWDIHSLYFLNSDQLERKRNRQRWEAERQTAEEREQEREKNTRRLVNSIAAALDGGHATAGIAIYEKHLTELQAGRQLPQAVLRSLISAMHQQRVWEPSIPLLVEILRREPVERCIGARLRLAEILIHVSDRPKQAMAVLKKLPADLSREQILKRNKLLQAAKSKLAGGSIEIDVHDW
jgi:membrane associated rhomboid family serine protease